MSDLEIVEPRPSALIESLRSFGYSPATAVADLIDNSITAGATKVEVDCVWQGRDSWISVLDDGAGMSEATLREAMRAGSANPLDSRAPEDLGRFGLGLKTASFSQSRVLSVASKKQDLPVAARTWDLGHVGATNRWELLTEIDVRVTESPSLSRLDELSSGTVVLWADLDRIVDDRPAGDERAKSAFYRTVDEIRVHCGMVFHRFMSEDGLQIRVNGQAALPWDPFLTKHEKTERLPDESRDVILSDGSSQKLAIQPFVLPHRSHLSKEEQALAAGPAGWNQHQGFYLYRARRLIVPGDWFNLGMKPEEHHKLARIRVEITQEMDPQWSLDVRKARARPPASLQDVFTRIARATRSKAEEVYRHRGRVAVGQSKRRARKPVWLAHKTPNGFQFEVNREHVFVEDLLNAIHGSARRRARAVLRLVETSVPVALILSQGFEDETRLPLEPEEVSDDVIGALRESFCRLLHAGWTEDGAREELLKHQPFDRLTHYVDALDEEACPDA